MQNVCLTNDLPVGVSSVDAGHHSGHVYVETVRREKVLGGVVEDRTAHVHNQDKRGTIVAPANYTTSFRETFELCCVVQQRVQEVIHHIKQEKVVMYRKVLSVISQNIFLPNNKKGVIVWDLHVERSVH